jgi:hypothetical protein
MGCGMIEKGHCTHVPHIAHPWVCPRAYRRQTVFVLGNGPSLRDVDLSLLANRNVIAVNGAVFARPGLATMLFFGDARWYWENRDEVQAIPIPRVTISRYYVEDSGLRREQPCHEEPGLSPMRQTRSRGLCDMPDTLCWNQSSGGTAIDLAAHTGADRIILLGFDMAYAADGARNTIPYKRARVSSKIDAMNKPGTWAEIIKAARARKITILNATPGGKLDAFPRVRMEDVL